MIIFAHTKFGLVRIQGSEVKRGGGGIRPPRSERVFQIPVQIGLKSLINNSYALHVGFGFLSFDSR